MARKPSWRIYHEIGKNFAGKLDTNYTYAEIAVSLGISKQQAYHETIVALGKLVYQLKKLGHC